MTSWTKWSSDDASASPASERARVEPSVVKAGGKAARSGLRGSSRGAARQRGADAPARRAAIRRRRIAAGAAVGLLLVVVIALALAGGGSRHTLAAGRALRSKAAGAHRVPTPHASVPTAAEEEAAVNRVLAYTPAVVEGGSKGHDVALTFDDGPGPYTLQLVHTLDRLHVHATFFAIGEMERYFSAGTVAEVRAGDVIGDHTETHPFLVDMSAREQREEIAEQMARVEVEGAPRPRLFRPPYGSFNATTYRELHALHLLMVLWSVDTDDYTQPGVQAIVHSALAGAHPGAIILMHDGGGDRAETIAALPAIVAGLRKRGLHPVTVPRLLLDDPPPPGRPLPTNLSGD